MTLQTNEGNVNDMDGSNREKADWRAEGANLGYKTNLPNPENANYLFYGVIQDGTIGTKTVGFEANDQREINMTLAPKDNLQHGEYTVIVEFCQQKPDESNPTPFDSIEYTFVVEPNSSIQKTVDNLELNEGVYSTSFTWESMNGIGSDPGVASGAYSYYSDGAYLRFQVTSGSSVVTFADVFQTGEAVNDEIGGMTLQTNVGEVSGTINDMDGSNRERADWGVSSEGDLQKFSTKLPNTGKYLFYGVIQNATVGTKTVGFNAGDSRIINMTLAPKAELSPGTYTVTIEVVQQGGTVLDDPIAYSFVIN